MFEDDIPGDGGDPGDVLDPLVEDDTGGSDTILAPVIEDDPGGSTGDGEILDPVIEVDPAPDEYWLYFDESASVGPAEIYDFDPEADILRITMNPELSSGTEDIQTATSEDGLDTLVYSDQSLIAMLKGVPGVDASNIYLESGAASFS